MDRVNFDNGSEQLELELSGETYIDALLGYAIESKATDVELKEGHLPVFRIYKKLYKLQANGIIPLTKQHFEDFLRKGNPPTGEGIDGIKGDDLLRRLERERDIDFAYTLRGYGRFRANIYYDRGGLAGVFRVIPEKPMPFDKTGLPSFLLSMLGNSGLILVAGPTGSGKTTTLSALIDHINHTQSVKVLTIEDPVEYIHVPDKALISQRQVGVDALDFHRSLRAALRQSPDVLLIGEMRDRETMEMALMAAETGHLVLTSVHAKSALDAIKRIANAFPEVNRPSVYAQIDTTLLTVVYQELIPKKDGSGLVLAYEILSYTRETRKKMSEKLTKGELAENLVPYDVEIPRHGCISMDYRLAELVAGNFISQTQALAHMRVQQRYETHLNKFQSISTIERKRLGLLDKGNN